MLYKQPLKQNGYELIFGVYTIIHTTWLKFLEIFFLSTGVHLHRVHTFITALEVQCNCHEILHLLFKQPEGSDCPSQSEFFFLLYLPFTAYQQFHLVHCHYQDDSSDAVFERVKML